MRRGRGRERSGFLEKAVDEATNHPLLEELVGLLQLLGLLLQPGKHSSGLLQQLPWGIREGQSRTKVFTVGTAGVGGGRWVVAMGGPGSSQCDLLWLGEWSEDGNIH